ncbi:hypothetical protein [Thalassorhabdomicrobium marinisediminis]|uniref:Uncharacterized protein n=1 Tax=Thalassorhabdomicrobium marinisediminis TaxID=2170577 RepID=A0A2T7FYA9_9RHOB|nr:hypothetical protein [Thalassorhabdomicrobium marinisediminis]PVA07154.1 hypothetical protein DC363_04675 [Thalassorhabdomicrobium marinisediminis]
MIRIGFTALAAAFMLGACAQPDIPSRLDSSDTFYSGFGPADSYTPRPVGARANNDLMRFSTMSMVH